MILGKRKDLAAVSPKSLFSKRYKCKGEEEIHG
jgi:hypothetical protein